MFAYVIIHFGSKVKYLEYEIYSILMLKSISKHDIVYMYSLSDTPEIFVKIIEKMGVKTKGFDDSIIIDASKKFSSVYEHFNTLRTCGFIYANMLVEYKKICIVESDIIFYPDFDTVFELKVPSVFLYLKHTETDKEKVFTNYPVNLNINRMIEICKKGSPLNGGVMLFKPDKNILKNFEKNFSTVIENNCAYPNETLFLLSYPKTIYNLPITYNLRKNININKSKIYGHHFDTTVYKPLDIIKDNYIGKMKTNQVKKSLEYFKKQFYDKYNEMVSKIISKIPQN